MSSPQPENPPDLSWANSDLKSRIVADPRAVLKDRGITAPPEMPLGVVHEFLRMTHLIWLDGKTVPIDQFYIDPADEGLLFGRGAWESTRTVEGVPWLWPYHIERLRQTCQLLFIPLEAERLPNSLQVKEWVRTLTQQDVVLRLNVTAGRPGKPGVVWMTAAAQPLFPVSMRMKSVRSPVEKGQAYLTLKTFQYATRLRLAQQATQVGFDTALLLDADNNIQEGSNANIFLRMQEGWLTPKADGGLLPGTLRRLLLERSPLPIREEVIPLSRLGSAREVFLTNSNIGIMPVTQIDGFQYPIGEETTHLRNWLEPRTPGGIQYRFRDRGEVQR